LAEAGSAGSAAAASLAEAGSAGSAAAASLAEAGSAGSSAAEGLAEAGSAGSAAAEGLAEDASAGGAAGTGLAEADSACKSATGAHGAPGEAVPAAEPAADAETASVGNAGSAKGAGLPPGTYASAAGGAATGTLRSEPQASGSIAAAPPPALARLPLTVPDSPAAPETPIADPLDASLSFLAVLELSRTGFLRVFQDTELDATGPRMFLADPSAEASDELDYR
ncbi:MAG: hypothetical protein LBW85_03895, partial [Deltaproteobacteria bacterium]|nr:hypothetical protein [Deltaproteobacteria bacterium]